jgi:hypothetical protein
VFASRTETQGLVLLESKALGTPVVSTAVMGTREVLRAGEGCLIAEDDEADFAANCVRLLTDRALRDELSAKAVRYAQGWSSTAMAHRMLGLYARVVDGDAQAPESDARHGMIRPSRLGDTGPENGPRHAPWPEPLAGPTPGSESEAIHRPITEQDMEPDLAPSALTTEQRKPRRALP